MISVPHGNRPRAVVLDPVIRRLVDASAPPPHLHEIGPADGRSALREAQGRVVDPDVEVEFRIAPVGPSGLVGFWIFRRAGLTARPGVVLYLHGGRWMLGDAQTHSGIIHDLVHLTGEALVVPEYTRTPEARYPVAVEEIYALLIWLVDNAADLDLDIARLAVAGDCAGATLAAAVTLMAKNRSGPRIAAQLLYYPILDPRCDSPSQTEFESGYLLTRRALRWYWQQYCDDPRELADPTAAPARASAAELAGLPPALVITAEADPARDEAEVYAERLWQAGVPVTAVRYLGTVHDFAVLTALRRVPAARAAVRQGGEFLRDALDRGRPAD